MGALEAAEFGMVDSVASAADIARMTAVARPNKAAEGGANTT